MADEEKGEGAEASGEGQDAPDGPEEAAAPEQPPAKKKLPGKVIVLYIGAPVLALIIAVIVLFVFMGGGHDKDDYAGADYYAEEEGERGKGKDGHDALGEDPYDKPKRKIKPLKPEEAVFVDLPDLLINLNTGGSEVTYLKLVVALEVHADTDMEALNKSIPKVIDTFQIYLRQMRVEDLSGSAGLFRLKEELLRRVNAAVYPIQVYNVLFKEMIIQ